MSVFSYIQNKKILDLNHNNNIFLGYVVLLYGNIWFGLRDLLKILDYKSLESAITKINISKETPQWCGGSNTLIKPHKKFINDCDEKLNVNIYKIKNYMLLIL